MEDVVFWSRMQFALTAMYHWLFVPLTLGLGIIISIMETIYYRTGKEEWKVITKFWMKLFGINFAIGVATGLILEFQFGTNWSNYSWFVGDIFGAPLAIEGMMAFFMESTFIAVMFFGWNKVSKGFHLASTWLTVIGASLSALWILVANAWMQFPIGMKFNPDTVRNEMASFFEVLLSPVAINKFFHTVLSGWVVGAAVVVGISALYMLKGRHIDFSRKSISIAAPFGVLAMILIIWTGDGSAYQVAQRQPMKLAAMEGLYQGEKAAGLVAFGILNPDKKEANDGKESFLMRIEIPKLLSILANRSTDTFVPGIEDLINGYTLDDGTTHLSAQEKMVRGKAALEALRDYKQAKNEGKLELAEVHRAALEENYLYFGYGFVQDENQLVPNVPIVFYAFRFMVILGSALLLMFLHYCYREYKNKYSGTMVKLVHYGAVLAIPISYLVTQAGWVVAEVGRQPWVIQDIMPTFAAISKIEASSVITTFTLFCILFTTMLIAELGIIYKHIKKGY
ncbi:MAG: cytochrome ubiquinol oxidase subunit I [Bacteroidales bacterium]